jgi:hypothetical protein
VIEVWQVCVNIDQQDGCFLFEKMVFWIWRIWYFVSVGRKNPSCSSSFSFTCSKNRSFDFLCLHNFFQLVAYNIESKLDFCGKQQSSFLYSHNHLFFLGDQWQNPNVSGKLFICGSYATFYTYH